MATTTVVGAPAKSGELLSERIAPGILPKVLGRFDMIAIFVAIVLFAVQGSVVQPAGAAAFVYWILGFVTFLIPGAIVTGQLGLMFPGEGSIYVWTNKALGSFWGFFAGFCAWWPGALVMVATADLVVTLLQFLLTLPPFNVVNPLAGLWQQRHLLRPGHPRPARHRGSAEHGCGDQRSQGDHEVSRLGLGRRHGRLSSLDVRRHGGHPAERRQLDHRHPAGGTDLARRRRRRRRDNDH